MDKGILNEVIEAEEDVQKCIERENTRFQEWLIQVKREASEEVAREEQKEKEVADQTLAKAKQEAESQVRHLVGEAKELAARIGMLEEGILKGVILKRLPHLLPKDHSGKTL